MFNPFKKKVKNASRMVLATQNGEAVALEELDDPAFATLGDGVCVIPADGNVYAPVDGTIVAVADTGHAFCMVSNEGAEILIHVGTDTVKLKGEGFDLQVVSGQTVHAGQLLCQVDVALIREKGYTSNTAVLLAAGDEFVIEERFLGPIKAGKDVLFRLGKTG